MSDDWPRGLLCDAVAALRMAAVGLWMRSWAPGADDGRQWGGGGGAISEASRWASAQRAQASESCLLRRAPPPRRRLRHMLANNVCDAQGKESAARAPHQLWHSGVCVPRALICGIRYLKGRVVAPGGLRPAAAPLLPTTSLPLALPPIPPAHQTAAAGLANPPSGASFCRCD